MLTRDTEQFLCSEDKDRGGPTVTVMEELSDVAVLVTHSSSASSPSSPPALRALPQAHIRQDVEEDTPRAFQQRQAADSLIQVIEKLSKIVEKRPQRQCTLAGQKRALQHAFTVRGQGEERTRGSRADSPLRKVKRNCQEEGNCVETRSTADGAPPSPVPGGDNNNNNMDSVVTEPADSSNHKRTVTCYQCSLCPYLSQTLPLLKEHLKQHNEQHSDLILMCSECRFTSRDQGQLEQHVRMHFSSGGSQETSPPDHCQDQDEVLRAQDGGTSTETSAEDCEELPQKKKWYSYEEYGLYRCLICSYVCSQQRMLKTHAWKHAGLVDCSYPIFEDGEEAASRKETPAAANPSSNREEIVVLSPVIQEKSLPAAFKLQLISAPVALENNQEVLTHQASELQKSPKTEEVEEVVESVYPLKDLAQEEPVVEVQVTTEAESEVEVVNHHGGTCTADSLLSSAQKIINSSPNSAGHINVIVERLPSAEDPVMAANPLLLNPDVDRGKGLLDVEEGAQHHGAAVKEAMTPDQTADGAEVLQYGADVKPSAPKSGDSPRDENIPPAGRKRTHSESLRLHSLAAEALVAMPMRTPELPTSVAKVNQKTIPAQSQKLLEVATEGPKAPDVGTTAALLDIKIHSKSKEEDLGPLGLGEGDEEGPAAKAGISLSLLTVIERLRERSDQNTSDEDILKELQDNAQFQNGGVTGVVTGTGAASYIAIPGMEGLVTSSEGGLVDYIPGSERPYRCRLCRYSSGNKGYIKQHLRVHRQRQPYQCPICEHIASDSKDLESHMIHHCKTRMYHCKMCPQAFHYKSQLRSHEREHHSFSGDVAALTAVTETVTVVEEADRGTDEECGLQKMYKCDVCDYTSSTYVGVRNHRRIHNSDKPYRCCSCDFATTNMNSLKSHMRRHPQEHQAVQLLEQYRCSLCGYVCSHPPSLKSHMWKHAGDQNYNYEQVNKAINEAISQSSRAPPKLSVVLESVAERPAVVQSSKDKAKSQAETLPTPSSTAAVSLTADSPATLPTPNTDPSHWPGDSPSPPEKDPAPLQSQSQTPAPAPVMEYCVLLFCCCICGFESTSKERLMEHMKEHEGDIISIILNKEQQPPQAQTGLQTAE